MRTRWLTTALLLVLCFSGNALGGTWLQDDQGRAAPPANYIGTGGQQTQVNATDRLPVETVADTLTAPTGPTTSTTDPMGWGMQWFTGTYAAAAANLKIMPVALSPNLIYGFALAEVGNTVELYISENQGRTWLRKQTLDFGVTWTAILFAYHLAPGWWLLGGSCGLAVTPGCTGLGIFNISGTAAQVALPGLAAGLAGGMTTIHQQGTTVMGTWVRGADSTARRCRSTDSGFTWACDAALFGTLPIYSGKGMDSPAPGVWLRSITTGAERSVDDGVTFVSVLAGVPGATLNVIECISSTVCLYTNGQNLIYRSTNAGATWALSFTAPGGIIPFWSGFVDYTNGVVAVVPSAASMDVWLSRDSGATWSPTFRLAGDSQRCSPPCQTTAINGIGIWSAGGAVTADKVVYSPTIGFGTVQIRGMDGNPLAVDAAGQATVKQGTAATAGWPVKQDGTAPPTIAPWSVSPAQGFVLLNSGATGAANTPVVATLTGAASVRAHLYTWSAYCSAGSASVSVTDGVTTWATPAGTVGTALYSATWPVAWTAATAATITVTLGTCGPGNTGTLQVQGDRF